MPGRIVSLSVQLPLISAYRFPANLIKTMMQIENSYFDLAKNAEKNCLIICTVTPIFQRFRFQENLIKTMMQIQNSYFDLAKNAEKNCLIICTVTPIFQRTDFKRT